MYLLLKYIKFVQFLIDVFTFCSVLLERIAADEDLTIVISYTPQMRGAPVTIIGFCHWLRFAYLRYIFRTSQVVPAKYWRAYYVLRWHSGNFCDRSREADGGGAFGKAVFYSELRAGLVSVVASFWDIWRFEERCKQDFDAIRDAVKARTCACSLHL